MDTSTVYNAPQWVKGHIETLSTAHLAILALAVLIILVVLADSLLTVAIAVLAASACANLAMMYALRTSTDAHQGGDAAAAAQPADAPAHAAPSGDSSAAAGDSSAAAGDSSAAAANADPYNDAMYGPYYSQWKSYQNSYALEPIMLAQGATCAESTYNIDAANIAMAQRRARDKKCSDGWASKDASYYSYHFGPELADTEAREWWTRNEW